MSPTIKSLLPIPIGHNTLPIDHIILPIKIYSLQYNSLYNIIVQTKHDSSSRFEVYTVSTDRISPGDLHDVECL